MKNFTKKQIAKMNSIEKRLGKLEWSEYLEDGKIIAEGRCRVTGQICMIDRDGSNY